MYRKREPNRPYSYKERIREILLDAGVNGLKQKQITIALLHRMNAAEIVAQLEKWRKVGAVQKFYMDELPYHPLTMWRATTRLAETDESGEEYIY